MVAIEWVFFNEEDRQPTPNDVIEPDTRTFGKRKEARLYYCDNCGRKHWGRYEEVGSWAETEWWFVWTTPQGVVKEGDPCGVS